ncbi:AfsR/SARP family transcriptional regulator [Actinoplanes awajinensis]|nr:hypothetical protein [Actinoplanes awajinensis]
MTRAAATLITLTVLAGPPLAAVSWLLRHGWPTLSADAVQGWLQRSRTPVDLVNAVVLVAAILWFLGAAYALRRTVPRLALRWRRLRQLPLPTPAQMTAGSIAGIAALALPTLTAGHTGAPPTNTAPPPADPDSIDADSPDTAVAPLEEHAGIELPGGGWVPYPTAAAVTALAGLIWLHRRRTYTPTRHRIGTHLHDPDLQPLTPTVQAITAAIGKEATNDHALPTSVTNDDLPRGYLYLHGAGAPDAARGLIVTAALTSAITPGTPARLQVRHTDWQWLLPGIDTAALPGIRLIEQPRDHPQGPPPGTPPQQARSSQTGMSSDLTMTTIVLDYTTTPTARWRIDPDGTTTGTGITEIRRLCTLDRRAATDLLGLIRRGPTTDDHPTAQDPQPPARTAAPTTPIAQLTLLGDCTLTVAGKPVKLRRTAGLQILTYLAIHPEGASRSELIAAIWPHLPPATITQRLHTTISALRSQLQQIGDPVIRRGDHYRLNITAVSSDLQQWRATAAEARTALNETARADACKRLLEIYKGELAATYPWPWINTAREAMRRDALDACITLADSSHPAEALARLQTATTIDPYNTAIQQRTPRGSTFQDDTYVGLSDS